MQNTSSVYGTVGAIVIIGLVLALRLRRMGQSRRMRLEMMWIFPLILAALTALTMWSLPPSAKDIPWLIGAAVIGGGIGWCRGKMMNITVDPDTHALNQQASPAALIFIVVILGIRYALRSVLNSEASALGISAALITDGFLVFAVAMFTLTRIEMAIRAVRLLREAKTSSTGSVFN